MEEKIRVKVILDGPIITNPLRLQAVEFFIKNKDRKTIVKLYSKVQFGRPRFGAVFSMEGDSSEAIRSYSDEKIFDNSCGNILNPTEALIRYIAENGMVSMEIEGACDKDGNRIDHPMVFNKAMCLFGFVDIPTSYTKPEHKAQTIAITGGMIFKGFHEISDPEVEKVSEPIIAATFGGRSVQGYWVTGIGIHFPQSVNYKGSCWIQGTRPVANDWISVVQESVEVKVGSQPWVPLQKAKE